MDILYEDIFDKCQGLSSFEGRRLKDASGKSMYPEVHITEQDKPLIQVLAYGAMTAVHAAARYAVEDVEYTDEGITVLFIDGNAKNVSGDAQKVLTECLSMHIMQHWLEDKEPKRSEAYGGMYQNLLASFTRLAYRKYAPSLKNY